MDGQAIIDSVVRLFELSNTQDEFVSSVRQAFHLLDDDLLGTLVGIAEIIWNTHLRSGSAAP